LFQELSLSSGVDITSDKLMSWFWCGTLSNSGQSKAVDITVELFCSRVPRLSSMFCDVRVEVLMSLFLKVF
jgi:hypothetical protein